MNSLNCYGYNENGGLFRSTNSQKGLQYPPVKRVPVKRRECDAFFEENFGETTDLVAIMKKVEMVEMMGRRLSLAMMCNSIIGLQIEGIKVWF